MNLMSDGRAYEAWKLKGGPKGGKIEALTHDWSRWHVSKYPTKDHVGFMKRVCRRCGEEEFRAIRYDCCPKTGDESNIALWATMCTLSVMMLGSAAVIVVRRKKDGTF